MKPQFTTPCYLRVDDLATRKELAAKLSQIGYAVCPCVTMEQEPGDRPYFVFNTMDGRIHIVEIPDFKESYIDCGTNIDLFKAIAAINDENDYMQYFTPADERMRNIILHKGQSIKQTQKADWYEWECFCKGIRGDLRKATIEELIEHFKNK